MKGRAYTRARETQGCDQVRDQDAAISVRLGNRSLDEFDILKWAWQSFIVSIRDLYGRNDLVRHGQKMVGAVIWRSRIR